MQTKTNQLQPTQLSNVGHWNQAPPTNVIQYQPAPTNTSQLQSIPLNAIQLQLQPTLINSIQPQPSNVGHWNQALVCNTKQHQPMPANTNQL